MAVGPGQPRIVRVAPGEESGAWRAALSAFRPVDAAALKLEGDAGVWSAFMLDRAVIVKAIPASGAAASLAALARGSRGLRHWNGAAFLAAGRIDTARCLALARDAGPPRREWLVMEALPGRTVLDHLAAGDLTIRQEHAVARAVGVQVAAIVRTGRFNRDHKPSNLIVTRPGPRDPAVAVIDCVAIRRRGGGLGLRRGAARMLASLLIEPVGVGHPPRAGLVARVLSSYAAARLATIVGVGRLEPGAQRRARRHIALAAARAAGAIIAEHRDPRPAVDPLARPLDARPGPRL